MSTPEIITVNSETLEATVRDLLPSQNGFGSELQASNVIMPIIDLTASAEGTGLSQNLQTAMSLDSITTFNIVNETDTSIISNTGFYRVFGVASMEAQSTAKYAIFSLTDGSTQKDFLIWAPAAGTSSQTTTIFDFVVFLPAGHSMLGTSTSSDIALIGNTRQIATITGELVNPAGFVAE